VGVVSSSHDGADLERPEAGRVPLVTVVVPVYNGGEAIAENVEVIRRAVADGLPGEDVEVVVVSDGSLDGSAERLLAARDDATFRVIHYDRNLGKGYAVKTGALAGSGAWVAIVDADLDLDPGAIPGFLDIARRDRLDLAIGSKRHPESVVHYPRSRRASSWAYQQLNRLLFGLDVQDTQVGLKVFSRNVADDVLPLLLVKRFAFDLELLAVAHELGYDRIRELPVRLEYRFTGSQVTSLAVARALWDTAAIFYRLRILRTYRRKRGLIVPSRAGSPPVTLVGDARAAELLDYPRLEVTETADRAQAARAAEGEVLALLEPGARPGGNWVGAAVAYLSRPEVAAVLVPTLTPPSASVRERTASAVLESRIGGGSRRFRYLPGNVHVTIDDPARSIVVRRADYLDALDAGVGHEHLVGWLARRGRTTVYTPDASIANVPAPVFRPHFTDTWRHGVARGVEARRTRGRSVRRESVLAFVPIAVLVGAVVCLAVSERAAEVLLLAYAAVVATSAALGGFRHRSLGVAALAVPALVGTQAVNVAGFVRGLVAGR
jgi:glycosyltransferase involved in cell wall biosynthesis